MRKHTPEKHGPNWVCSRCRLIMGASSVPASAYDGPCPGPHDRLRASDLMAVGVLRRTAYGYLSSKKASYRTMPARLLWEVAEYRFRNHEPSLETIQGWLEQLQDVARKATT